MRTYVPYTKALWQKRAVLAIVLILLLVVIALGATFYIFNLPRFAADQQQTLVFGPARFSPEDPAAVRVLVRNQGSGQPIANANVSVRLVPQGGGTERTLFTGQTDARGTAPVEFTLPPDAARDQTLVVEASSNQGRDHIEKPVVVARSFKVLVTTDKPLYQPGQALHLRALALGALDRAPAKNAGLEFLIEDPKGNKVFRKTVTTSAFGVASADFTLAETVTSGEYKITATLGDVKSEKSVTVKPYVLPKFKVSAETERAYYVPGDRVTGQVSADYFFGKPVAKSAVTLKGVVYDVERVEMVSLQGQTDPEGAYSFSFDLPNYFAGRGLDKERADFALEITVTDLANHSEQTSLVLPIARDPIIVEAVAESGRLIPGVENIVYVLTTSPDGAPLETDVSVQGTGVQTTTRTGPAGLAEIRITPRGSTTLTIAAKDKQGRGATHRVDLPAETTLNQILLRADRATYHVGETMHLDLLTTGGVGTVYLDLVKEGQTLSTRAVDSVNGHAAADIDVTAEMIGTLQVHAYHVERDSTIVRDTRLVVVEQPDELNLAVRTDQGTYRPGDTAHVAFDVTNGAGKGVVSALGISVVDESVFALEEQDPGFAKLYFLLQQELLEPKYQVKGFQLPEVVSYTVPSDLRVVQDQSARAAWANASVVDFALRVDSQVEKRDAIAKAQTTGINNLTGGLAGVLTVLPLLFGGLVMASLSLKGILRQSLQLWILSAFLFCVGSPFLIGALAYAAYFAGRGQITLFLIASVGLAWVAGYGLLLVNAILKRDTRLLVGLVILGSYFIFAALLSTVSRSATNVDTGILLAVVLTYLAQLAVLILLAMGFFVQKDVLQGIVTILLALLFIPATFLLAALPSASPFARAAGNPILYVPPAWLTGCGGAAAPGPGLQSLPFGALGRAPAAPTAAPAPSSAPQQATAAQAAPRVRQFFPETLYVNPEAITDENGRAALDIPLADSITTWRLSATASSQRGELGATRAGLRVFQDFFVDLDLPIALTQNDEISVPVAVYNYLPHEQQVRLQIEKQAWFELNDEAEKKLTIASNDIQVVYFRIKALDFGAQRLKVTALGEKMSDAIQREVRVDPDGKPIELTDSNWLKGDTEQTVEVPTPAIPGASRVQVKIYPGVVSQVVNGLDNILRMPFG